MPKRPASGSSSRVRHGACLCQKVRYELKGEPFSFVVCHCKNCQKQSGSAFLANAFFKPDQVVVVDGKDNIKSYTDKDTESGFPLIRSFCYDCGSSLFIKNSQLDIVIVCTGPIEEQFEIAPRSEMHIGDKRPWLTVHVEPKKKRAKL